ncbi:hypothetical protein [Afipia felis]
MLQLPLAEIAELAAALIAVDAVAGFLAGLGLALRRRADLQMSPWRDGFGCCLCHWRKIWIASPRPLLTMTEACHRERRSNPDQTGSRQGQADGGVNYIA